MSEKLTLDALRKLRDQKQKELAMRDPSNKEMQVIVGMGTCGIAAGAKETFAAILDALEQRGMATVLVRQTGCMGLCHSEPTVEVIVPGMPSVIYGNVNAKIGRQIVEEHVVGRKLLDKLICDRPAMDIIG
ncbi:MAG: (2Fe-2S) ferredoxin domain-containing protein [Lentisphaerae bacterium]|nr:(2Fe-2S) ferredoxin domain-containing protein [Lentisphaerota bacterium]